MSQCTNTSINSPNKLFVSVPTNPKRRKMWLQLARRDPKSILSRSNVFMCEDHFDHYPYVARICKDISSLRCSGVLISRNLVLTSGYCVYNTSKVRVYLGTNEDLCSKDNINDKRTLWSRQIFIDKYFNKTKKEYFINDVGMILLSKSVDLTSLVEVAKLTSVPVNKLTGKKAVVEGWGPRPQLQNLTTTISSQTVCSKIFGDSFIESQHGCAKVADAKKMYILDSGSPVEYEKTVIGYKTNDPLTYTNESFMFVDLFRYLPFIEKTINDNPSAGDRKEHSFFSLLSIYLYIIFCTFYNMF